MRETCEAGIGKMDHLVQILLAVLLVYNDVVSFSISSGDTIQYLIAQGILYLIQKSFFIYNWRQVKWWQILLDFFEIGSITIPVGEKRLEWLMLGYYLRIFLGIYCQLFMLLAQKLYKGLSHSSQIMVVVAMVLGTVTMTILQSMKFRFVSSFVIRWVFQMGLLGLAVLILAYQSQPVIIVYFIFKLIFSLLLNFLFFRHEQSQVKRQMRYALLALNFFICIDHGPFYEFRWKALKQYFTKNNSKNDHLKCIKTHQQFHTNQNQNQLHLINNPKNDVYLQDQQQPEDNHNQAIEIVFPIQMPAAAANISGQAQQLLQPQNQFIINQFLPPPQNLSAINRQNNNPNPILFNNGNQLNLNNNNPLNHGNAIPHNNNNNNNIQFLNHNNNNINNQHAHHQLHQNQNQGNDPPGLLLVEGGNNQIIHNFNIFLQNLHEVVDNDSNNHNDDDDDDYHNKEEEEQRANYSIVSNEVMLYSMNLLRLNAFLQAFDGFLLFLVDFFVASDQRETGQVINYDYVDPDLTERSEKILLSFLRFHSQIILAVLIGSFLINQLIFVLSDKYHLHSAFCTKKIRLRELNQFIQLNTNLIYLSANISEIDIRSLSGGNSISKELQQLVENTLVVASIRKPILKIKDVNNAPLIKIYGLYCHIDLIFHDFLVISLRTNPFMPNYIISYPEEQKLGPLQLRQITTALNHRMLTFGFHHINVKANQMILKAESNIQMLQLNIVAFYKNFAQYLCFNPSQALYDLYE